MSIINFLEKNKIAFKKEVPLSQITGMNIKGNIPIIAYPCSIKQLKDIYLFLRKTGYTYEIVGNLSNTYLCEHFTRDVIIKTIHVRDYCEEDFEVKVGCGYGLTQISRLLSNKGISNYEGFIGIPGTVGAAAINNSGAFDTSMGKVVKSVEIINSKGELEILNNSELQYKSRDSILKRGGFGVLLSVKLDISNIDTSDNIKKKINQYTEYRRKYIDGKRKSLGSVVKGSSINIIWQENKVANVFRKIIYFPFKCSSFGKKAQCISEFLSLGGLRFVKHCDNLGRFCWTKATTEKDFFDYISFIKRKSNNKVEFEIDIKK